MRRLLALTTTLLTFAVPSAADARIARTPDNIVRASPTAGDRTVIHRAGVGVFVARGDTVDSTNYAEAFPHDCSGCEGIAAAFQAVIIAGSPSTITPTNLAVAVNSNCDNCGAFAYAYQYVVTTDGKGRLSRQAREDIEDVEDRAEDLVEAGLPYPELDARLQQLADRFRTIVRTDLDRQGLEPRGGRQFEEQDDWSD